MRDTLKLIFLAALFLTAGCAKYDRELMGDPQAEPAEQAYAEQSEVPAEDSLGVGMFNEITYYGQWYHLEPYGWVWHPHVVSGWQPLTNGHWIWSQYGWMWVDYDPWGWATSHYGYWTVDFGLGWIWVPDYTWSPVQCDWIIADDTVSWAPMPPPGVRYKEPWEDRSPWVTVPVRRFKDPNVAAYRTTPKFKDDLSTNLYRGAPDVRTIERSGARFSTIQVQLDRRVVGEREFARVKYPPDQQSIIQNERTRIKSNTSSARFSPMPSPPQTIDNGGSGSGGNTVNTPSRPPSKSKEPAKGDNDTSKETRYKDKKSDEKKDDGKKDESKKKG